MSLLVLALRHGIGVGRICNPVALASVVSRSRHKEFSSHSLIGPDFVVQSPTPDLDPVTGMTVPEFVWSNLASKENLAAFVSTECILC